MLKDLKGQIERVTYSNEENGFTIARLKVLGNRNLVTIIGNILSPMPGEILQMRGEWSNHPKYGEQFKIMEYKTSVPASVYGIKKYLGSGLIKGIGPVMAQRMVNKFGEKTLDIIEDDIEQLVLVEGIGKKRIKMIKCAWEEQKEVREVMLFLQSHGVSSAYAGKIFKRYGQDSIKVVQENPYQLARDIFGIGFITADKIAENLGFSKDCIIRIEAGCLYVLNKLADEGHVYYPYEPLIEQCRQILGTKRQIIAKALAAIAFESRITIENINQYQGVFKENNKAVYLSRLFVSEGGISDRIKELLMTSKFFRKIDETKAIDWVQGQLAISMAKKQEEAIRCSFESKIMAITGGPGTGKTTIINAILKIFSVAGARILLAAPTGRAAKRMSETTGQRAKTIHRLLEYSIKEGGFKKDHKHPLKCDLLIVDEASMIDTILMYHLLKAVPPYASLILVGDVNQLPSVGAGNVLNDIISSGILPVVELNEIFRQAKKSMIIVNAHRVNQGSLPITGTYGNKPGDFYFIEQDDPQEVLRIILEMTKERIPERFGFDPLNDIQILSPMHKGVVGASNLNLELQKALNPSNIGVASGSRSFLVMDKVMQIKNNYDKDVYNGDIGLVLEIDHENQEVIIAFDGRKVAYDFLNLDEIVLAYAVSVHKSQGSEYPVVIIPILLQHYMLLQRNLIYTAMTRGRKLVILIGSRKAMSIGIQNNKIKERYSLLKERLRFTPPS